MEHPDIIEAAVASLPHEEYGEVVKAWVEISEDCDCSPQSIKDWANNNMASYKCPTSISIVGKLPKNLIGKVQRRTLQEADPIWKEKYEKNK